MVHVCSYSICNEYEYLLPDLVLLNALSLLLLFFMALHCTFWDLCASALLAHVNTCLQVVPFVFLIAVCSHISSVIMSSSIMPLTIFSFSLLFSPGHIHLPLFRVHSCAYSFCFLLIYSIAMTKTVSLC